MGGEKGARGYLLYLRVACDYLIRRRLSSVEVVQEAQYLGPRDVADLARISGATFDLSENLVRLS